MAWQYHTATMIINIDQGGMVLLRTRLLYVDNVRFLLILIRLFEDWKSGLLNKQICRSTFGSHFLSFAFNVVRDRSFAVFSLHIRPGTAATASYSFRVLQTPSHRKRL